MRKTIPLVSGRGRLLCEAKTYQLHPSDRQEPKRQTGTQATDRNSSDRQEPAPKRQTGRVLHLSDRQEHILVGQYQSIGRHQNCERPAHNHAHNLPHPLPWGPHLSTLETPDEEHCRQKQGWLSLPNSHKCLGSISPALFCQLCVGALDGGRGYLGAYLRSSSMYCIHSFGVMGYQNSSPFSSYGTHTLRSVLLYLQDSIRGLHSMAGARGPAHFAAIRTGQHKSCTAWLGLRVLLTLRAQSRKCMWINRCIDMCTVAAIQWGRCLRARQTAQSRSDMCAALTLRAQPRATWRASRPGTHTCLLCANARRQREPAQLNATSGARRWWRWLDKLGKQKSALDVLELGLLVSGIDLRLIKLVFKRVLEHVVDAVMDVGLHLHWHVWTVQARETRFVGVGQIVSRDAGVGHRVGWSAVCYLPICGKVTERLRLLKVEWHSHGMFWQDGFRCMHRHRLIRAADTAHTRRHGTGQYASAKVIPPHSWSLETELLKVHIFLLQRKKNVAGPDDCHGSKNLALGRTSSSASTSPAPCCVSCSNFAAADCCTTSKPAFQELNDPHRARQRGKTYVRNRLQTPPAPHGGKTLTPPAHRQAGCQSVSAPAEEQGPQRQAAGARVHSMHVRAQARTRMEPWCPRLRALQAVCIVP